jgi:septal ring factor EnvC (AmiA/AmiB activator)
MTTANLQLDRDVLRATFETWSAAEDSLDAQLTESLEALAAYQSHLDAWQCELAAERAALIQAREQLECEKAAVAANQDAAGQAEAQLAAEREAAREREKELTMALDAEKQLHHLERAQLTAELRQAQDALAQRADAASSAAGAKKAPPSPQLGLPRKSAPVVREGTGSAVLGSIVEQFGKLRQQRAVDREASKRTR